MHTTLKQIEFELGQMRSKRDREEGRLQGLKEDRAVAVEGLAGAVRDVGVFEQVQALYLKAGEYAREQLKARIEETVSAALQAVFEDDSEFKVGIRTVGGVAAAEWQLVSYKDGVKVVADVEDGDGGGAADIVSLALRASLLELSRPRPEGPFVLDEPGKMVDKLAIPNTAQFVKEYIKQTGRQGIMITHHEALEDVADVAYRVSKGEDGLSEVVGV